MTDEGDATIAAPFASAPARLRPTGGVAVAVLIGAALSACSLAPPLVIPEVPVAATFRKAPPWIAAQPADTLPRGDWWMLYVDPDLDALQRTLVANSPDLAAALARYQQAQAIGDQARAGLLPTLSGNANVQRNRQSAERPLRVLGPTSPDQYSSITLGLQLDYELDLWGRVRNQVVVGDANAEAAQADLESARLSLQAQLADNYMSLRGLDRQVTLLNDAVANYRRALD